MRLSRFTIRNFKAINELTLRIPKTEITRPGSADFLSLVGENNCSKSTVMEALRLALPATDLPKPSIDHFRNRNNLNGPIEIELEFDNLTQADCEEQGIRTHIHDGKYTIKKTWHTEGTNCNIYAYGVQYNITWPEPATNRNHFINAGDGWNELITSYEAEYGTITGRITNQTKDSIRDYAVRTQSPLVQQTIGWIPNPGGFNAHVDSVLPKVIFIPAIRETKEESEVSKNKSAARLIVETMFTNQLSDHPAIALYNEAGERVRQLFSGEERNAVIENVENKITEKLQRLINLRATLDFTPPDISSDLATKTFLEISDGNYQTKPEHQGHGAQRALILSLLELLAEEIGIPDQNGFRRSILILFEEPEIYLHPQMCRKMRDVLISVARRGTAQVICTTHSPVFLDLADRHDGIAIFKKTDQGIDIVQRSVDLFPGGNATSQRQRLRMMLDFNPAVNEVFFSKEVCLVEGDCEIAALEAIAKTLSQLGRIDYTRYLLRRREIVMVNCSGKWTIVAFQRVLNGFDIKYRVVHDVDDEGDAGANNEILSLLNLGENQRLLHNPNFEQQIFGEHWRKDKPWRATRKIQADTTVSQALISFFEFVIGKRIEELI
ncbi:AAA family ATPase [Heliobacterium gestii]|uniref:AAA family ATPase n=1 Tax=Heliomicrobium gestii TaxID=2699 RepID=A0A845L5A8_HELGE|nr:AAA family ATPase [Heliomicrobium gestii]MBM7865546.1 putative ATP-dependent endonuclease of OLD family [Heliomicrobium gestii]MZP41797.1 AAA family ATPase [Heliomicrobium gestii]